MGNDSVKRSLRCPIWKTARNCSFTDPCKRAPCRGNTLHGGFNPLFENSTWDVLEADSTHVKLHFTSPDGAQVSHQAGHSRSEYSLMLAIGLS